MGRIGPPGNEHKLEVWRGCATPTTGSVRGWRGYPAPGLATGQARPVLLLGCSVLAGAAFRVTTAGG